MTPAEIISNAIEQCHADTSQIVPSTDGLKYLNFIYQDFGMAIMQNVGEDFFYDEWDTDAVADQPRGEYALQAPTSEAAGIGKIKQLLIKPTTDADQRLIPATQVDVRHLAYDWAWYLDNQSAFEPIYYVADQSVFIAPNFDAANVGSGENSQIKLRGIKRLIALTYAGAEATVIIPSEFHKTLSLGMEQYIYKRLGKNAEAAAAKAEYENQKLIDMNVMSDRDISIGIASTPDESLLE